MKKGSGSQKVKGTVVNPSTGPRTQDGKSRVRHNALKDGIFSVKLIVREEEKKVFADLERDLRAQLKPGTPLLELAFERVLTASWRYRQAVAMEARRFGEKDTEEITLDVPSYFRGRPQELNLVAHILAEFREQIRQNGGIYLERYRKVISEHFGQEFYDRITGYSPPKPDKVHSDEQIYGHRRTWGQIPSSQNEDPPSIETESPVLEEKARWNMALKLVDLELQHIKDVRALQNHLGSNLQREAGLDTFNRYITSAAREMERAIIWYQYLQTEVFP